jgi:hypothetical protein
LFLQRLVHISSRRWSASSKASSINANVSTTSVVSLSLSNWFSSSSFRILAVWRSTVGLGEGAAALFPVVFDETCSLRFVDVWEGTITEAKDRLIATDGGCRRRDVLVEDVDGCCREGGTIGCGVKRGRVEEGNTDWCETVGFDEEFSRWTPLAVNSSACFSRCLSRIDDVDNEVETRFGSGTSFVIVSGAVRLRSLGDDLVTLPVSDELILLVVVIEEQTTDRGGEIGCFWKRLKTDIRIS